MAQEYKSGLNANDNNNPDHARASGSVLEALLLNPAKLIMHAIYLLISFMMTFWGIMGVAKGEYEKTFLLLCGIGLSYYCATEVISTYNHAKHDAKWFTQKAGTLVSGLAKEYRQCPYCKEKILAGAIKCKHCGEFIQT